jgi:hypothetical protein
MILWCILMVHKSTRVPNVELISQVMMKSFPKAFTGAMVRQRHRVLLGLSDDDQSCPHLT